jgi:hypothetical protein
LVAAGSREPAFDATAYALNSFANEVSSFSFRGDAVKNLIIFTDEPHNRGTVSFSEIDQLLTDNNALFNAVLSGSDTEASIGPLATGHGGAVFDLNGLNVNTTSGTQAQIDSNKLIVSDFVTQFANAKLQETIDFCVANPTDPACINVNPDPTPDPTNPVPVPPMAAIFALGLAGLLRKRVSVT